MIKRRENSFSL